VGAAAIAGGAPTPIAARIRPDADAWQSGGTVRPTWIGSRVVLAWARQAPGMLSAASKSGLDWHLDPVDRARAILPMAVWLPADIALDDDQPTWVVQGMIGIEKFPAQRPTTFAGHRYAGVVPAFIATINVTTGATRFFADPAADSLGVAWARAIGPLVEPATAISAPVRRALTYHRAWFESQLNVLGHSRANTGTRVERIHSESPVAIWQDGIPAWQVALEDPERGTLSALVIAQRRDGVPRLNVRQVAASSLPPTQELVRVWARFLPLGQLRDSATAIGDSVHVGGLRWHDGAGGLSAWRPTVALSGRGVPSLLWIATAQGDRIGGERVASLAWASVEAPQTAAASPGSTSAGLELARLWMARADSALARGDFARFGDALTALRSALGMPRR